MIRSGWVALLLVAMLSGSASAECAWVLWTEETRWPDMTWTFDRNIHGTRRACESDLPSAMDSKVGVFSSLGYVILGPGDEAPKSGSFVRKIARGSLRRVVAGAVGQDGKSIWLATYDFHCFPDTFDPRGQKR
jgi:hypothetical protein